MSVPAPPLLTLNLGRSGKVSPIGGRESECDGADEVWVGGVRGPEAISDGDEGPGDMKWLLRVILSKSR